MSSSVVRLSPPSPGTMITILSYRIHPRNPTPQLRAPPRAVETRNAPAGRRAWSIPFMNPSPDVLRYSIVPVVPASQANVHVLHQRYDSHLFLRVL